MAQAARALITLHLRQLARSRMTGGRPTLDIRRQGRWPLMLLVLLYFGWQLYHLGAGWVADHSTIARPAVFLLLQPVLTTISSAAGIIILIYAFSALAGTFLDGRDLQLLLVAPIRRELIFGERIAATSLSYSGILLITVPALFALGSGVGINAWFYPVVVLAILILPIAPTSVAALILLALLPWLPPARARTISLLVGVSSGLIFYVGVRLGARGTAQTLPSLPSWLPTTWPARAVSAVGLGDAHSVLLYGAPSLVLAAALFTTATVLSARVLGSGVRAYHEIHPTRRAREERHRPALPGTEDRTGTRLRRFTWWPLLSKDWRALRRDPQRQILYLYPLAIIAINAFQVLSRPQASRPEVSTATTLFLLFLTAVILVNTTTPGIMNLEGRSLVLLAIAPVSQESIILSKSILAIVPPLVIVEAVLIGLSLYLHLPAGEVALLVFALAVLIVALAGATLLINIVWPKLDVTNPRRPSSAMAAIVSLVADAVITTGSGILLFLTFFVWHGAQAAAGFAGLFAGLAAIIVFAYRLAPAALRRLMYSGDLVRGSS